MVKSAHVNMMADTIIANLSMDGLRAVLRGMLASKPDCTPTFEEQTRKFIRETGSRFSSAAAEKEVNGSCQPRSSFEELRKRVSCMVGCGLCYEALPLLQSIVNQLAETARCEYDELGNEVAFVDGAIVQTLTAVQKTLFVATGVRELSVEERSPLHTLLQSLQICKLNWQKAKQPFPLERGLEATVDLVDPSLSSQLSSNTTLIPRKDPLAITETFTLNGIALPRIFTGLWQLSSPAWGTASQSKIMEQFSKYVQNGFTAFDMADHYGDSEIIFVGKSYIFSSESLTWN